MSILYKFIILLDICLILSCTNEDTKANTKDSTYPIATVATQYGKMHFWLYNETPKHKEKFIELAEAEHYNQFTFNRVVKKFVVQGGCPDSVVYFKDSPYLLFPEFIDSLKHDYGALGMGRDNNPEKKSNACQFYIVANKKGLPRLDGDYMIFGKLLKGFDVLELIEKVSTDSTDTPVKSIKLDVSISYYTANQLKNDFQYEVK